MAGNDDLLTSIINDPKKFLEVLRKIDANGDRNIAPEEFIAWVEANADKLNVQGHNVGADLRANAANAANVDKLSEQMRDPNGPDPVKTMQELEAANKSRKTIQSDVRAVADVLMDAAEKNRQPYFGASPAEANRIEPDEGDGPSAQQQKQILENMRSGKLKISMSDAQKKQHPNLTQENIIKLADMDARESAAMKAEEQQRLHVVKESVEVQAIRDQVAKYQVDDLEKISKDQLQPLITHAAAQPASAEGKGR